MSTLHSPWRSTSPIIFIKTRRKFKNSVVDFLTLLVIVSVIVNAQCNSDYDTRRYRRYQESYSNSTINGVAQESDGSGSNKGIFVQIPHSNPPTVRPPPYTISHDSCPPLNVRENWIDTLCGDLNTGYVPQNPLGHKFTDGGTYPFETIKNKTLDFFRRALPILKSDKSLPKVAKFAQLSVVQPLSQHLYRAKRGIATRDPGDSNPLLVDASYGDSYYYDDPVPSSSRRHRRQHSGGGGSPGGNGFCENGLMGYYSRLCKLYNSMWGKTPHNIQRDNSGETRRHHGTRASSHNHHSHHHHHQPTQYTTKKHFRQAFHTRPDMAIEESDWTKASKHLNTAAVSNSLSPTVTNSPDMPPTPCPSAAEYLTPVFARNHEGAWRYVVQIPKEGYFTQTVEVTKCLKSNCFYMDGSCKTSPRWQSLLVAELFYPDTTFPTTAKPVMTTTSTTTTRAPPPLKQTTLRASMAAFGSMFGGQEIQPDYLYSKGQSSASLEDNLSTSAGVNYSNELGLPFKKRAIRSVKEPSACDGYDDVGCYQVRLFYDWFLIPGSFCNNFLIAQVSGIKYDIHEGPGFTHIRNVNQWFSQARETAYCDDGA